MLKNQQKRARTEISGLRFILTSCSQSSRTDGCTGRGFTRSSIASENAAHSGYYERASLSDCILAYHQQLTVVVVCASEGMVHLAVFSRWQSTFGDGFHSVAWCIQWHCIVVCILTLDRLTVPCHRSQ